MTAPTQCSIYWAAAGLNVQAGLIRQSHSMAAPTADKSVATRVGLSLSFRSWGPPERPKINLVSSSG